MINTVKACSFYNEFIAIVFGVCLFLTPSFALAGKVNVINLDNPNEGFNDQTPASAIDGNSGSTIGQQRALVFDYAADIIASIINIRIDIDINAKFIPLSGNTLAQAGSYGGFSGLPEFPRDKTFYLAPLANQYLKEDRSPNISDFFMDFNSGTAWYYGFGSVPSNKYSLLNIILHEIIHGLGFAFKFSFENGTWFYDVPDIYSSLVHDHDHDQPLLWSDMNASQRKDSLINAPHVCWSGDNVRDGSEQLVSGFNQFDGFRHPRIYAPNNYQSGSSGAHFSSFLSPNELMEPAISSGVLYNSIGLAKGLLADIGWLTHGAGDKPVLSRIAPLDLLSGSVGKVSFSIFDNDNALNHGLSSTFEMGLIARSSNEALIPNSQLVISGTFDGQSRTDDILRVLSLTPLANGSGQSYITITATDSDGNTGVERFSVNVTQNTLPTITITAPEEDFDYLSVDQPFSAKAQDKEDGVIRTINWSYRRVGTNNYTPETDNSRAINLTLADGKYQVRACVTDEDNNTQCVTIIITVSARQDYDEDGLNNGDELMAGADPYDRDTDDDGIADGDDARPLVPSDDDQDGIDNAYDNCPAIKNHAQIDIDADHRGDACDIDIDGDGFSNNIENKFETDPRDKDDIDVLQRALERYSNLETTAKNVPLMGWLGLAGLAVSLTLVALFRMKAVRLRVKQ